MAADVIACEVTVRTGLWRAALGAFGIVLDALGGLPAQPTKRVCGADRGPRFDARGRVEVPWAERAWSR